MPFVFLLLHLLSPVIAFGEDSSAVFREYNPMEERDFPLWELRGKFCGVTQPQQLVFRDSASWYEFWESMIAPYNANMDPPAVDFSYAMVIGVFLGTKDLSNQEVEIRRTWEEGKGRSRRTVVAYELKEDLRGIFSQKIENQPFHMREVPLTLGQAVFRREKTKK